MRITLQFPKNLPLNYTISKFPPNQPANLKPATRHPPNSTNDKIRKRTQNYIASKHTHIHSYIFLQFSKNPLNHTIPKFPANQLQNLEPLSRAIHQIPRTIKFQRKKERGRKKRKLNHFHKSTLRLPLADREGHLGISHGQWARSRFWRSNPVHRTICQRCW